MNFKGDLVLTINSSDLSDFTCFHNNLTQIYDYLGKVCVLRVKHRKDHQERPNLMERGDSRLIERVGIDGISVV